MRCLCIIRGHGVESISCKVDTRTREVLSTVHNPLKSGDDDYDREGSDTVV
jgi:hypothetical protein